MSSLYFLGGGGSSEPEWISMSLMVGTVPILFPSSWSVECTA